MNDSSSANAKLGGKEPLPDHLIEDADALRARVYLELRRAGFRRRKGLIVPPKDGFTKEKIRGLHEAQRDAVLVTNERFIEKWEDDLIGYFADGSEVDPSKISPRVHMVEGDGWDAALFRFASLHWSVPVSKGYGRRTRFLVFDDQNDKIIGIFALGDPVYNLRTRDDEIGWGVEERSERLYNVLDAFVLGALPPYRQLLGAKLIAMTALSDETQELIGKKYSGQVTVIQKKAKQPRPVLITVTSALGKSSIYNRLKFRDEILYERAGFTQGFGHFQFSEDLFASLCEFLSRDGGVPEHAYGAGPNWRMRTLRVALSRIGLNPNLLKHGVEREVFLAPLAHNWKKYLKMEAQRPRWLHYELDEMNQSFLARWAVPRSERDPAFQKCERNELRLSLQLEKPAGKRKPI